MDYLVSIADEIKHKYPEEVKVFLNLKSGSLTTFAVGADIPVLIEPNSITSLEEIIVLCRKNNCKYRILGAGSNIVMPDQPLNCIVVRLGDYFRWVKNSDNQHSLLEEIKYKESDSAAMRHAISNECQCDLLTVFSRASLMQLSVDCCRWGFSGLECAAGIPASVGGALKMNAGAHNWDIGSITRDVLILDEQQGLIEEKAQDLGFTYRGSAIRDNQIVVAARFAFFGKDSAELMQKRKELLNYRRTTQPLSFPSAGSVFKNPDTAEVMGNNNNAPLSAGKLLENTGLKGYRSGGVEYSELHANWLIKVSSSAKAEDVVKLVYIGQSRVKDQYGITLVPEIKFW